MIAELGLAALWLGAALAGLQLWFAARGLRGEAGALEFSRSITGAQGLLGLTAASALAWGFWQADLSLQQVVAFSNSGTPAIYRLADFWNHDAGFALLLFGLVGLGSFAFDKMVPAQSDGSRAAMLGLCATAGLGTAFWLLRVVRPFARFALPQGDGHGFDPVTQSPAHGFIGPFFAAGAAILIVALGAGLAPRLVGQHVTPELRRAIRPWAAAAWLLLATALALHGMAGTGARLGWVLLFGLALAGGLNFWLGITWLRPAVRWCTLAGLAIWLAGGLIDAGTGQECRTASLVGEQRGCADRSLRLESIEPVAGEQFTALEAGVAIDGGTFHPQSRTYWALSRQFDVPDGALGLKGSLTISLGAQQQDGRWPLHVERKPGQAAVRAGAVLTLIGGALALWQAIAQALRRHIARGMIAYRRTRQGRLA